MTPLLFMIGTSQIVKDSQKKYLHTYIKEKSLFLFERMHFKY